MKCFGECFGQPSQSSKYQTNSPKPRTPPAPPTTPSSPKNNSVNDTPLYVILPYFNYCHFQRRKQLFIEFIERYKATPGIALVVVEAALQGEQFDLPNPMPEAFAHFRVISQDPIWLKENLINIGVSRLPDNWRMMAWVDADITFMNELWVEETKASLTNNPMSIVQMFKTAANLGPDEEVYRLDRGFAWCILSDAKTQTGKYTDLHPGFAWACSRKAYEAMGGLIDWAILGSGDRHMALALIGDAEGSAPGGIHSDYKERLKAFGQRCKASNLRLGVINGTILHHWHGRLADRKYRERWNILVTNEYNPSQDVCRSHRCGLLQFTETGKRLVPEFYDYFQGRKEDTATLG